MGTRKLGRPTAHRMSMLYGMAAYLIENGKIETTLTRAKEVSSVTEKLITLGKKGGLANFRKALAVIPEDTAKKVLKLFKIDTCICIFCKNEGFVQIRQFIEVYHFQLLDKRILLRII